MKGAGRFLSGHHHHAGYMPSLDFRTELQVHCRRQDIRHGDGRTGTARAVIHLFAIYAARRPEAAKLP